MLFLQGLPGKTGRKGPRGQDGPKGFPGESYIKKVDPDNLVRGEDGPVGDPGDIGDRGMRGMCSLFQSTVYNMIY